MYQLIGLEWFDRTPYLVFNVLPEKSIKYKKLSGYLYIKRSGEQYCVGYHKLDTGVHIPCDNTTKMPGGKYKQCKKCEEKEGFYDCKICNGESCHASNSIALKYCNQEHLVYLAYFEPDIIKVGTASEIRKEERLLEQGALYFYYIANVNSGRAARIIEREISKLGITTRVSTKHKLCNFIIKQPKELIEKKMEKEYLRIISLLPKYRNDFLKKPIVNDFLYLSEQLRPDFEDEFYQLDFFSDHKTYKNYFIYKGDVIQGEYLGTIGSIIALKNKNKTFIVDLKQFFGWEVFLD